jgi:Phage portal protein
MGIGTQFKHAWNAFTGTSDNIDNSYSAGASFGSVRPDRVRLSLSNERSIVTSIYTRLAIDFADAAMRHVVLDEHGRFKAEFKDGLNSCLSLEANIDQTARAFRQDLAESLFDQGVIVAVPIDTTANPSTTGGYDIQTMRIGYVTRWMPKHVKVSVYNDTTGKRQEVVVEKKYVAIVINPLFSVMNEQNSTLQRLIRKLNLLDAIDEQSGSGKLDLIIQLPYAVKSETRRQQAMKRREDIEFQLKGSKYGVAYTDGTEKITQLNRPTENNLMSQIEYLIEMLYGQLGLTPEIMNGTADEAAMLNYMNRTIGPLLDEVTAEFRRKFLTKTARTQGHSIEYYRDPFKLVPIANIAEIADKFTRNEILSANEIRSVIGFKPSTDPKADKLVNSNMPAEKTAPSEPVSTETPTQEGDRQNGT